MVDLANIPQAQLEQMGEAGLHVLECQRVLSKTQANVVGEVLKGGGEFYEWDHYPKGDVYDWESHSQYYYHAHPVELRGGEHGHFHTFLRPKGMPEGIKPAEAADFQEPAEDNDAVSHLAAFSMDGTGQAIRIFTTNRWVTGETWYEAEDVIAMLDRFEIDLAYPSWPVNIWLTAMVRLFRPQIETLLTERDRAVADWAAKHPDRNVFEDRELEITSMREISIEEQITAINAALQSAAA